MLKKRIFAKVVLFAAAVRRLIVGGIKRQSDVAWRGGRKAISRRRRFGKILRSAINSLSFATIKNRIKSFLYDGRNVFKCRPYHRRSIKRSYLRDGLHGKNACRIKGYCRNARRARRLMSDFHPEAASAIGAKKVSRLCSASDTFTSKNSETSITKAATRYESKSPISAAV